VAGEVVSSWRGKISLFNDLAGVLGERPRQVATR
jgi:hypothetical protein